MSEHEVKEIVHNLLSVIGFNSDDIDKTAERYAKVMMEFNTPEEVIKSELDRMFSAVFPSSMDELVIARDIEVWMLCPHHLLPVKMKVHIGYLPNGKVLGLSKLPRLAKIIASRPELQENYTKMLADILFERLKPRGVMIVVEGEHLCVRMRGVKDSECVMNTSAVRGEFLNSDSLKREFLSLVSGGHML